jgi:hypothetical protein
MLNVHVVDRVASIVQTLTLANSLKQPDWDVGL